MRALCDTKKSFTTKQPTLDSKGNRIDGPEELAAVWKKFLNKKFSPTELENLRAEFDALPECTDEDVRLQRKEFEDEVKRMKMGESWGKTVCRQKCGKFGSSEGSAV